MSRKRTFPLFVFFLFSFPSCITVYQNLEVVSTTRNSNVCSTLKDTVVLYAIFVDTYEVHPFSEYDIASTMDSVQKGCDWLMNQNPNLHIQPILHDTKGKLVTAENRFYPSKFRWDYLTTNKKRTRKNLLTWADYVSYRISKGVKRKRSRKIASYPRIRSLESLVFWLRNLYKTDNVAVMFFVNGYYEHKTSASYNTFQNGPDVEFSIVSQKNPADIIHEFLHLFGAVDLYPNSNFPNFNYKDLGAVYPNDIMRATHKDINKLMLSPITKYYIGWETEIERSDARMLYHHHTPLEY